MPEKTGIVIVVAVARNGVIGRDGDMPWRLPTDLKHFKTVTMGKPIVMGRKTFESIGRPLPGRTNIVVSRKSGPIEGVEVVRSLDEAIALGQRSAEETGAGAVAVVGGGEIYAQALPLADTLHVTHVEADIAGDARFPAIDPGTWHLVSEDAVPAGERDSHDMRFALYRRIR
jgi:Dihydrofolate reductase